MKTFNEWVMKETSGTEMMSNTRDQMHGAGGMRNAAGLDIVDQIIQNMDPTKWTNLVTALKRIAGQDQETLQLVNELSKFKSAMLAKAKSNAASTPLAQAEVGNPAGQNPANPNAAPR